MAERIDELVYVGGHLFASRSFVVGLQIVDHVRRFEIAVGKCRVDVGGCFVQVDQVAKIYVFGTGGDEARSRRRWFGDRTMS